MITPKSVHQIDLECIEIIETSVYQLVKVLLHVTLYSIRVFHDFPLITLSINEHQEM